MDKNISDMQFLLKSCFLPHVTHTVFKSLLLIWTDPVPNKSVYNSSSKKWRSQESPNINVVKKKWIELGSIRLTDSNHQRFIIFDVSQLVLKCD
jgi:hypothetical protein